MPIATAPVRETREMRLISRLLAGSRRPGAPRSLPAFLAIRREPGPEWRTWEQITLDLYEVTGELITREGIRRWARKYGIPEDTKPNDSPALVKAYHAKLKRAGIEI
jgi:hypothetical protein